MIRSVLGAGIALFVGAASAGKPQSNYCPEDDFVNVCLKAGDRLADVARWANKNGWKVRRFNSRLLRDKIKIQSEALESFDLEEIEFSDAVIHTCSYDLSRAFMTRQKMGCGDDFPSIASQVPADAVRIKDVSDEGEIYLTWQYELGDSRVSVSMRKSQPKYNFTWFSVTRLLVQETSEPGLRIVGGERQILRLDPTTVLNATINRDRTARNTGSNLPFVVSFVLTDDAAQALKTLSRATLGKKLRVLLGKELLSAPIVQEPLVSGRGILPVGSREQAERVLKAMVGK